MQQLKQKRVQPKNITNFLKKLNIPSYLISTTIIRKLYTEFILKPYYIISVFKPVLQTSKMYFNIKHKFTEFKVQN